MRWVFSIHGRQLVPHSQQLRVIRHCLSESLAKVQKETDLWMMMMTRQRWARSAVTCVPNGTQGVGNLCIQFGQPQQDDADIDKSLKIAGQRPMWPSVTVKCEACHPAVASTLSCWTSGTLGPEPNLSASASSHVTQRPSRTL